MPKVKTSDDRRNNQPLIAAVVQPVARRLGRIEDLLIEMRYEQDVQLKRVIKLGERIDVLTDPINPNIRRLSLRGKKPY
jgi:hypothetical protein